MPKPLRKNPFRGKSWSVPPETSSEALIVDEVSIDYQLSSHAHIAFYANMQSTLAALMPAATGSSTPFPNKTGLWIEDFLPTDCSTFPYGFNSTLIDDAQLSMKVLRDGSQSEPDRCFNNVGSAETFQTCGVEIDPGHGNSHGASWVRRAIFIKNSSVTGSGLTFPARAAGWSSTAVSDVYIRHGIKFESNVLTGMNEIGLKLWEWPRIFNWWLLAEFNNENKWHLKTYNGFPSPADPQGDLEDWGSGVNNSTNVGDWHASNSSGTTGNPVGIYLFPDTWHTIETHVRMSSDTSTADGLREAWFDDQLLFRHNNCITHSDGPAEFSGCFMQVYHGGSSTPTEEIFVQHAGIAMSSTRRIGPLKGT